LLWDFPLVRSDVGRQRVSAYGNETHRIASRFDVHIRASEC
jgi:hypothetical protein